MRINKLDQRELNIGNFRIACQSTVGYGCCRPIDCDRDGVTVPGLQRAANRNSVSRESCQSCTLSCCHRRHVKGQRITGINVSIVVEKIYENNVTIFSRSGDICRRYWNVVLTSDSHGNRGIGEIGAIRHRIRKRIV